MINYAFWNKIEYISKSKKNRLIIDFFKIFFMILLEILIRNIYLFIIIYGYILMSPNDNQSYNK